MLTKKSVLSTKAIAYTAVLAGLSIVVNTWSINTPIFSISLNYLVFFIAGYFLGPILGAIVGITGDLLGCVIQGYVPNPIIACGSVLLCIIPALVRLIPIKIRKFRNSRLYIHLVISFVLEFVIVTTFVNTFGLWLYYFSTKKTFWVYMISRLPIQLAVWAINLIITGVVSYPINRFLIKKSWIVNTRYLFTKRSEDSNNNDEVGEKIINESTLSQRSEENNNQENKLY